MDRISRKLDFLWGSAGQSRIFRTELDIRTEQDIPTEQDIRTEQDILTIFIKNVNYISEINTVHCTVYTVVNPYST